MRHHLQPQNPSVDLPTLKLSTLSPLLDRLLSGGLPAGSVTELAGPSSSGKTQLSLQLLLSSFSSLLIHSDDSPFPLPRLHRLLAARPHLPTQTLDRIFVASARSADHLLALLASADALLAARSVRLVVVDSIAALFRADFDNSPADLRRRSELFFRVGARLKELAVRFGAVVVVTNQVVDVVEGGGNGVRIGNLGEMWSNGVRVCPALGLSWANCVNVRLFLARWEEVVDGDGGTRTRRKMEVVFAPHLPPGSCEFVIVKDGVFGVESS